MRRKRDSQGSGQRHFKGGSHRSQSGGGGFGSRQRHGGGGGGGGYGRRGNGRQNAAKVCPMCGAVVDNLAGHIRQKHDDPHSHPRD